MRITIEEKKVKALQLMEELDIYKPYRDKFAEDGTITLFESFAGYYIGEDNEPELLKKIRKFEEEGNRLVYAVIHTLASFGDCYDFLFVPDYRDDWEYLIESLGNEKYAFAYVYNSTDEWCSDMGTIGIEVHYGGLRRIM